MKIAEEDGAGTELLQNIVWVVLEKRLVAIENPRRFPAALGPHRSDLKFGKPMLKIAEDGEGCVRKGGALKTTTTIVHPVFPPCLTVLTGRSTH